MDDPVIMLQLYPLAALFLSFLYIREWVAENAEPIKVR